MVWRSVSMSARKRRTAAYRWLVGAVAAGAAAEEEAAAGGSDDVPAASALSIKRRHSRACSAWTSRALSWLPHCSRPFRLKRATGRLRRLWLLTTCSGSASSANVLAPFHCSFGS